MSWHLGREEKLECPEDFALRLAEVGGVNRYDEPNFRLLWGQTAVIRAGGRFEHDGYVGYRDIPMSGTGDPCWLLCQWNAPELYGTPEGWYLANLHEDTGLQLLGEYPYRGRYEVMFPLVWKGMRGSELAVEHLPLNDLIFDMVVPVVMAARDVSLEKKRAAYEYEKERRDNERLALIEDARRGAKLQFGANPVSYGRQGFRTPLIEKRMKEMERHWNAAISKVRSLGRGFSQQ